MKTAITAAARSSQTLTVCCLALSLLALLPRPAAAHDKWLDVDPFVMSAPAPLKVYLVTGDALQKPELLPVQRKSRMTRFQFLSVSGKRDLLPLLREDQQPIASVEAEVLAQGTSVLLLDTAPIDILLNAEKFQAYLFEEHLMDILVERAERREEDAPGRERYSRSLKAIVQVGTKLDELATRTLGQELEIVPLVNPYGISVGGKLTVQEIGRAHV